jgi:type II secretory pathway component PulF
MPKGVFSIFKKDPLLIYDLVIFITVVYLIILLLLNNFEFGASVAKWLAHLPFTSEVTGSSLSENFLNATRTQSSCEKSKSQRSAESRGFPPGTLVSSHRES